MLGGKGWDEWIAQYGRSHQHPINRFCHTLGIPLIALSLPLFVAAFWVDRLWLLPWRCSCSAGSFNSWDMR